jgi:hypothetical protein
MAERLLNELSVRRANDAAKMFDGMRARGMLSQLPGRRLVILVHGYNVRAEDARGTYQAFLDDVIKRNDRLAQPAFCTYWSFHWPGDHDGPPVARSATSLGTFSIKIEFANKAGRQLAALLRRLGSHQEVYFIAHSLGCRVVLATLYEIENWCNDNDAMWPGAKVKGAILMAAAVPWMTCDKEPAYGSSDDVQHHFHRRQSEPQEWVFYSDQDGVLNVPFGTGEYLHGEGGGEAVGVHGRPGPDRWDRLVRTKMHHREYWPDTEQVVKDNVPTMLGLTGSRKPPAISPGRAKRPWRLLPVRSPRRRSLGAPLDDDWQVLIREDGSATEILKNLTRR